MIPNRYGQDTIEKTWNLLVPSNERLALRHITSSLCKYFFHILEALKNDQVLPYVLPFSVRCQIDFRYQRAVQLLKPLPSLRKLAKDVSSLEGDLQGSTIIVCLEHLMIESLGYAKFFRQVIQEIHQLQTIREVSDDQMADFFATCVHYFRKTLDRPRPLQLACDELVQFWGFCIHLSESPAGRSRMFQATIAKLGFHDIPLCLWIFVTLTKAADMSDASDGLLCNMAEAEINNKMRFPSTEDNLRWLCLVVVTVNFLLNIELKGFYEVLGPLLKNHCGRREFESVWRILSAGEELDRCCESLAVLEALVESRFDEW